MRRAGATPTAAVATAVALAVALRALRLVEWPLLHPDGPAYVGLARRALAGDWLAVLGGYYSPLYPMTVAPLAALGVPAELAARLVAACAGVAVVPLAFGLARGIGGDGLAAGAALVVAAQPALVKASAQVLPETLAGLLVVACGLALAEVRGPRRAALAGALAGLAYLARPEALLLVAIGVVWIGRRRPGALACFVAAAFVVAAPALLALHARTGTWQISPREAVLATHAGLVGETTLAGALVRHPVALAGHWAAGAGEQAWDTIVAVGAVLALPLAVGVWTTPPGWPLAVAVAFVLGPLALNPSPRYAVPILPLLAPWIAAGLVVIGRALDRRAAVAMAGLLLVLGVQALWKDKPFDEACSREVGALLLGRYGPGRKLVAVDGRFAYVADGVAVVPKTTAPHAALDLARRRGAPLWLTRPQWLGKGFAPPGDVREVARPCGGAFVLYEVGAAAP